MTQPINMADVWKLPNQQVRDQLKAFRITHRGIKLRLDDDEISQIIAIFDNFRPQTYHEVDNSAIEPNDGMSDLGSFIEVTQKRTSRKV